MIRLFDRSVLYKESFAVIVMRVKPKRMIGLGDR